MSNPVQPALFEEDYLLRTLGRIARDPYVALTELVANAWDAGAFRVDVRIPDDYGDALVVEDDGTGMTSVQFRERWMTLAYNRIKHQGRKAEFPPERMGRHRPAYGHNGVGRHGLLCFADSYIVETYRAGRGTRFLVATQSGENPFVLEGEEDLGESKKHGTILRAQLTRRLPSPPRVRSVLASTFLADPEFTVFVNDETVPLVALGGNIDQQSFTAGPFTVEAICIDSDKTGRTTDRHGVAFWVAGRLVGEPSWIVGGRSLLDGRTRAAKRLTIVIRCDELIEHVEPDWSSFRRSEAIDELYETVADYVADVTRRIMAEHIEETRAAVISENRNAIDKLQPLGRMEVSEFTEELATALPTLPQEILTVAVQAVIRLEESRTGRVLLSKLAEIQPEDIDGLSRLLDQWTIRDALTVLDEIQRRICIVEALEKLVADQKVAELKTLHPLVTQARWLFGPEYESSSYVSNASIRRAVKQVFGETLPPEQFVNPRKRPDLAFLPSSTISAVGVEDFEPGEPLAQLHRILILELKKGGSSIGRAEMHQAMSYVDDFLHSGHLGGNPTVQAFVVGYELDTRVSSKAKVGENDRGLVQACTFDQLVRTANMRLFALRQQVEARYDGLDGAKLAEHLHSNQRSLFEDP